MNHELPGKSAAGWLLLLILATGSARAADIERPIEVIWKPQLIELDYWSPSVSYSCLGIVSKVSAVLRRLGARPGFKVWSSNCAADVSAQHLVTISVETPVAATPERLQEMTTFDAREQLIAKVRGEVLPTPAQLERFTAIWTPVSLGRELSAGDCELVQSLGQQVLPKLSVRVVAVSSHCPSSGFHRGLTLKVLALLPLSENDDQLRHQ